MDDGNLLIDSNISELSNDLSYLFASHSILQSVKKEWELLKNMIPNTNPQVNNKVKDFDKLLNYFF